MCPDCIGQLHSHHFCPGCGTKCEGDTNDTTNDITTCNRGHRFHQSCSNLLQLHGKCPHCDIQLEKPLFSQKITADKSYSRQTKPSRQIRHFSPFQFTAAEEEKILKISKIIFRKKDENFENLKIEPAEVETAIDGDDFELIAAVLLSKKRNYTRNYGITKTHKSLFHYSVMKDNLALAEIFLRFGSDASEADNLGKGFLIGILPNKEYY